MKLSSNCFRAQAFKGLGRGESDIRSSVSGAMCLQCCGKITGKFFIGWLSPEQQQLLARSANHLAHRAQHNKKQKVRQSSGLHFKNG